MKKKISKFVLARKKVLQIGFVSLFIFLAFFNFAMAQNPGDDCGPILTGGTSEGQCSGGEAFPSCQLLAPCNNWDATGVGRCYFKDLIAASYCISTKGIDFGEDVEILLGDPESPVSICIDSPSGNCGGPFDEEWTWNGTASINEYINMPPPEAPPGTTLNSEIDAYAHHDHDGNCNNTDFKSETWGQAQASYTYQLCCPHGYTYDESGSPMCVAQSGTDCENDLGGTCCGGQVCPIEHQLLKTHDIVTGCPQPEKCCAIGQCVDSAGNDCIVDNQGRCCDLSTSTCNIPKIGTTGCGAGTICCLSGFCVPNSPSIPTDPTEDPAWEDVSWTPLVKIPGMPAGEAPLGGYIVALYNFLLGAIGIIAMVMLVYGGFRYMTSAGNPTAMGDAKDIFYSAIIGLALALISYLIIGTINPELLFTQDAKLAPFGSPEYSTNLPANSCSYNVSGFEPDNCRCIGDDAEEGGDTTCEVSKAEYNWTGNCDDLCKNKVCVNNPECCAKADLMVGTSIDDVSSKEVTIYPGEDAENKGIVFFDTLSNSYNCGSGKIVAVAVDVELSWWDFGFSIPEYGFYLDNSVCVCEIALLESPSPKCKGKDKWCNSKDGRFRYDFGTDKKTYSPILKLCVRTDAGECYSVEDRVTVIVK